MTVNTTNITSGPYSGNGSTVEFSYTFRIVTKNQILVYVKDSDGVITTKTVDTDYTVSGLGDDDGGLITFSTAPVTGETVYIRSNYSVTQVTDFDSQGGFFPDVHESAIDKLTFLVQQLQDQINRAARIPVNDDTGSISAFQPIANGFLRVNSSANGIELYTANSVPVAESIPVTDYTELDALPSANYSDGQVAWVTDEGIAGPWVAETGVHTANTGTIRSFGDDVNRYWRRLYSGALQFDWFEPSKDGTNPTSNTSKLLSAVNCIRSNENPNIIQYISGPTITAYASGVIEFGYGVYAFNPDQQFTQDMGLTIRGKGSRGMNQAIIAPTTIAFSGTTSGYGFQFFGNGARNPKFEDLDICYLDSGFTGHILDFYSCPRPVLNRVRIGTYGNSGATRLQTAASMIRLTYHEGTKLRDCILDGGVDGVYFDDTRTLAGNTFGGWGLTLDNCTWYDFTGDMIRHEATRTTKSLNLIGCNFNPINVDCVRALHLENVDNLNIVGGLCTPSTTHKASTEWFTLDNCTGTINGHSFGDLSKAGTIGGNLKLAGNVVFCTDGFTLTSGVIESSANEFSQCTNGYTISPTSGLSFKLGPDLFKAAVTNSYNIPSDSSLISGKINYDSNNDASTNRFATNPSERVSIENFDQQTFTVTSTTYSILRKDTGRTLNYTGAGTATWTLPPAEPGLKFKIYKQASQILNVQRAGSDFITDGTGGTRTTIQSAASDVGGYIEFESVSSTGWRIVNLVGTWT